MLYQIVFIDRYHKERIDGLSVEGDGAAWRHCWAHVTSPEFINHPLKFTFCRLEDVDIQGKAIRVLTPPEGFPLQLRQA